MTEIITTFLKIDGIDYKTLATLGEFVSYDVTHVKEGPYGYEKEYNHCLDATDVPHYYESYASTLHAFFKDKVQPITVKDKKRSPVPLDVQSPKNLHSLMKVLYSDMFNRHGVLVNNTDVYLQAGRYEKEDKVYIYTIKPTLSQHHRHKDLFYFEDTTVRFARLDKSKNINLYSKPIYTSHHIFGLLVLSRVKPSELKKLIKDDSVELYSEKPKKNGRTQVEFFNEYQLNQCKAYHLHRISEEMVGHLKQVGINASIWKPEAVKVDSRKKFDKETYFDFSQRNVYIVDGRLRADKRISQHFTELESPTFRDKLFQIMVKTIDELRHDKKNPCSWLPLPQNIIPLEYGKKPPKPDDLVLILLDNLKDDWTEAEKRVDNDGNTVIEKAAGVLYGLKDSEGNDITDNYKYNKELYPFSQSINVNSFSAKDEEAEDDTVDEDTENEEQDENNVKSSEAWRVFLSYSLPHQKDGKIKLFLKNKIPNCFYQLGIKDVVRDPINSITRYPLLRLNEFLQDTIFLAKSKFVYLDNNSLVFNDFYVPKGNTSVPNEQIGNLIEQRTGWNLDDDIVGEVLKRPGKKISQSNFLDTYLMISPEFVLEIIQYPDKGARLMPDIAHMQKQQGLAEIKYDKELLEYGNTNEESNIFRQATDIDKLAKIINQFLDNWGELAISLSEFMGTKAKEVMYPQLAELLHYDPKRKQEVSKALKKYFNLKIAGDEIGAMRSIPGYQGIHFIPKYNMYHVGDKGSAKQKRSSWFRFYEILIHQLKDGIDLETVLKERFFPLLEVPYIHYGRYTVRPFPFSLLGD